MSLYQQYLEQGYLVMPNFISDEICNLLISHATYLITSCDINKISPHYIKDENGASFDKYFFDSTERVHYFLDKNALDESGRLTVEKKYAINKLGHGLHKADALFNCFSNMHPIIKLLEQLQVTNPTFLQSMYLCKQPFIGDEVDCHQDETYIWLDHGHIVGLWFALEDATIENGCLYVLPTGHHERIRKRMIRTCDDQIQFEHYDKTPWPIEKMVPLEVKKGSVIVLHGKIPHLSTRNHSAHSRHAYSLHVKDKTQTLAVGNWLKPVA